MIVVINLEKNNKLSIGICRHIYTYNNFVPLNYVKHLTYNKIKEFINIENINKLLNRFVSIEKDTTKKIAYYNVYHYPQIHNKLAWYADECILPIDHTEKVYVFCNIKDDINKLIKYDESHYYFKRYYILWDDLKQYIIEHNYK